MISSTRNLADFNALSDQFLNHSWLEVLVISGFVTLKLLLKGLKIVSTLFVLLITPRVNFAFLCNSEGVHSTALDLHHFDCCKTLDLYWNVEFNFA